MTGVQTCALPIYTAAKAAEIDGLKAQIAAKDAEIAALRDGATLISLISPALHPDLVAELQEHCKRETAPYKFPRIVEFATELPKTASGKVRRALLREDG